MNKKLILCGLIFIIVGILLLASAWVSSNVYGYAMDAIIYSPWLNLGFIFMGLILIIGNSFSKA